MVQRIFVLQCVLGFIAFIMISGHGFSQEGYHIDVQIDGSLNDTLYLAYFYGDANYIRDTAFKDSRGHFVFQKNEKLPEGVYIFVLPPENSFFQVMIGEDQHFEMQTTADNIASGTRVEGSEDNRLFYDYLSFIEKARAEKTALEEKSEADKAEKSNRDEITELDRKVLLKQDEILKTQPNSLTAMVIGASREPEMPDFSSLPKSEQQKQGFLYYHKHYFDNVDLKRPAILRTPFIHQKVMDFFEKYTYQEPDSLNKAIDYFFSMLDEKSDTYRYFLVKLLNKYANPTIVGQDAVYVHLAQKYYGKGKAPWVDSETLDKILDNAERFSYTLIGKNAPPLQLYDIYSGKELDIRDIRADFKVLIFWSSTCSHCEKVMPTIPDIIKEIDDADVKFVTVCTKADDSCREFTDKNGLGGIAVHTLPVSAYGRLYDVRSTPKVFILDSENKIATKGIGFNQIAQVIDLLKKEKSAELN